MLSSLSLSLPQSCLCCRGAGSQRLLMLWGEMRWGKGLWVGKGQLWGWQQGGGWDVWGWKPQAWRAVLVGGGGLLHPHLPASGNDRGGGGCSPQPQEAGLIYLYSHCTSTLSLLPGVLAASASVPSLVGGGCVFFQAQGGGTRLYGIISESGCWRNPVSVPLRELWAVWSHGGLRGLSQTPVGSRAGWGRRAG